VSGLTPAPNPSTPIEPGSGVAVGAPGVGDATVLENVADEGLANSSTPSNANTPEHTQNSIVLARNVDFFFSLEVQDLPIIVGDFCSVFSAFKQCCSDIRRFLL